MRPPKTERPAISNFFADRLESLCSCLIRQLSVYDIDDGVAHTVAWALYDQLAPMALVFFFALVLEFSAKDVFVKALLAAGIADAVAMMDAALVNGRTVRLILCHRMENAPLPAYLMGRVRGLKIASFVMSVVFFILSSFIEEVTKQPIGAVLILLVTLYVMAITCLYSVLVNELCASK